MFGYAERKSELHVAPILDLSSLSLDTIFTIGQTIQWLKGYRLGKYGFIGKDNWNNVRLNQDDVTDILSEVGYAGKGRRALVEIGGGSTPIPLHVFFDSAPISNISDAELLSLYQFSTKFHDPEYKNDGAKYITEKNWRAKPFISIEDTTAFSAADWHGLRLRNNSSAYEDVTRRGDGPQMPLANFAPASRENLIQTPIRSFLAVPEVMSIQYQNVQTPVSFIWNGRGSQPTLDAPGDYTEENVIKLSDESNSTTSSKNTTNWGVNGKIDFKFNFSDILKSVVPVLGGSGGKGDSDKTKGGDIAAEISGNLSKLIDTSTEEILRLKKDETHTTKHTYNLKALDSRVNWDDIKTLTFEEYYRDFKDVIIANPTYPAPETVGDQHILVSGARVSMSNKSPIVKTRVSAFNSVNHAGQVLGQVWQGFLATFGADYLFSSNPSADVIHADAAGDPKEILKFANWLKQDGSNSTGRIYKNLEDLGFLSRLWGNDRFINVDEGGKIGAKNQPLISYVDDNTLNELTTKTFSYSVQLDPKFEFSQTYDGKTLAEAVLEQYSREHHANSLLMLSDATINSSGVIKTLEERGTDQSADRSQMLPRGAATRYVSTGHSKGTKGDDIFTVSGSQQIALTIDLRKDLSSDTIVFGGDGSGTTGQLNIINYDPSKDVLTGELVDSLVWSYDPVYHVVRGISESEENSSIQQVRERAHNGEALLVNVYLPFGKFRERDGKIFESDSKDYNIPSILADLNSSDSIAPPSALTGLIAEQLIDSVV